MKLGPLHVKPISNSSLPVLSDDEAQQVEQLGNGMALLHYNLLSPVVQHGLAIVQSGRHGRGDDFQGLEYHIPAFQMVGLQQRVEHLQYGVGV